MNLVLARVDQRLVHGQVVVGWVPALGIERILVVDDVIAKDQWEQEMLSAAAPPGVTVEVAGSTAAPEKLKGGTARTLVLVRSLDTMLELVREGCIGGEVNIGGLHARPGARRLLDYVYVTEEDVSALKALDAAGVRIRARDVPGNPAVDLNARVKDGRLDHQQLPEGL